MNWALVLGGAACVFEDEQAARLQFGEPDTIVGVKDIAIEYPRIDHWVTFHLDRVPNEIAKRRALGYPDPKVIWTFAGYRLISRIRVGIPIEQMKIKGGSSGLLGAMVGMKVANKAILAGIPMDSSMPHFNDRKRGKPWEEARIYIPHWKEHIPRMQGHVRSMRGWTQEVFGAPTREWLYGNDDSTEIRDTLASTPTNSSRSYQTGDEQSQRAHMADVQRGRR